MTKRAKMKKMEMNVKCAHELRVLLQKAAPDCPIEVASAIAVDIADLGDVASEHRKHVQRLLKYGEDRHNGKIEELLAEIDTNILFHADYHLKSLKKNLPKYARHLRKAPSSGSA